MRQSECPADILLLVFEEVLRTAPASLRDLRLTSRTFTVLINPIVYRHLKLNDAIVKCFDVKREPKVSSEIVDARRRFRNTICTFTRQITIDQALDRASVVNLVSSLGNLHHIYWSFWNNEGSLAHNRPNQISLSILNALVECGPNTTLSVDNLSSKFGSIDDFSSLPPNRIVSLKTQAVLRRRFNQAERTLKSILLKCDRLEVLHLLDVQSGSRFADEEIEQCERLPAVEELFLQGYFWLHSPSIAASFWDWSRLTSLRLEKVFIVNFLKSVAPENLLQLRSLITDGHCESNVDHTQVSVFHVMRI